MRYQLIADQYKRMFLFSVSLLYKIKRLTFHLEFDDLLNQRHNTYTVFDGINTYTYTYDYGLCGRTTLMRLTFKL